MTIWSEDNVLECQTEYMYTKLTPINTTKYQFINIIYETKHTQKHKHKHKHKNKHKHTHTHVYIPRHILLSNATFKCPTASCKSDNKIDPPNSNPVDDPKLECDNFFLIDGLTIGLRLSFTLYGFTARTCVHACVW